MNDTPSEPHPDDEAVDTSAFNPRLSRTLAKLLLGAVAVCGVVWGVREGLQRVEARRTTLAFAGEAQEYLDRYESCLRGDHRGGSVEEAILWRLALEEGWDVASCREPSPYIVSLNARERVPEAAELEAALRDGYPYFASSVGGSAAPVLCEWLADRREQANVLSERLGGELSTPTACGVELQDAVRWGIPAEAWQRDFVAALGWERLAQVEPLFTERADGESLLIGVRVPLSVLDDLATVRGIQPSERVGRRLPTVQVQAQTVDGTSWEVVPVEVEDAGWRAHERVGWARDAAGARWVYAWRDRQWVQVALIADGSSFIAGAHTPAAQVTYLYCGEEGDVLSICQQRDTGPTTLVGTVPEGAEIHHVDPDGGLTYIATVQGHSPVEAFHFGADGSASRAELSGEGDVRACSEGAQQWVVVGTTVHVHGADRQNWREVGQLTVAPASVGCVGGTLGGVAVREGHVWLSRCGDDGCREVDAMDTPRLLQHELHWATTPTGPSVLLSPTDMTSILVGVAFDGDEVTTALYRDTMATGVVAFLHTYRLNETWYVPLRSAGAY